jgi:hypothetical protein
MTKSYCIFGAFQKRFPAPDYRGKSARIHGPYLIAATRRRGSQPPEGDDPFRGRTLAEPTLWKRSWALCEFNGPIQKQSLQWGERIARAAPPFGIANEDALIDQGEDVTMSRVLRALGDLGIFGGRELAFEAVK